MKKLFERVIAVLDFIIPKDEKIIVFGGNEMRGINGNVAAVIEAWPNNFKTKGYKPYIASAFKEKLRGLKTIDPKSIIGVFVLLRAKTTVISHDKDLYWRSIYKGGRRRVINLWHGAPIKRIGPWKDWGKTTALIAASETERLALAACTEVLLENIFVTGYPRIDLLIKRPKQLKRKAFTKLNIKDGLGKLILYAPTYRKGNKVEGYLHRRKDFSSERLIKFLEKSNTYLIVRPHQNDFFSDFPKHERIIFANSNLFPEIEPLYAIADVLVTDYSSSIFEYIYLNRPVVGFAPDLEEYKEKPGLIYDYETIFPGPIAKDWKSLQKLIEEAFKDPSKYESIRKDRLALFHKFLDGKSTDRVIDLITDLSIK